MSGQAAHMTFGGSEGANQPPTSRQIAVLFGVLLAVQFAIAVLMQMQLEPPEGLTLGAAFSQPALLAVWAVFGPQRAAVRLPATLWLAAAGCLCITFSVNQNAGENDPMALLAGGVWLAAFAVLEALLWLIRAARRWRLERPEQTAIAALSSVDTTTWRASKSASQFSVRALLGWTLAVSLLLGGFRALAPNVAMHQDELLAMSMETGFASLLAALVALPAVALAWIVLADGRRLLLRIVLSLLVFLGLAAACNLFGPVNDLIDASELLGVEAGVLLNALVSFGVIRACGFRLRRRSKKLAAAEQIAPPPISRVRFAFALAPLAVVAACLAASVPGRLEQWRQAEICVEWRRANLAASFAADGTIDALECLQPAPISDDRCRLIASIGALRSLVLTGSTIDDRQLALLAPLSHLERLDLTGTAVTDAGLEQLAHFPQLVALDLADTPITDAGLGRLKTLPKLRELTISLTDVSDEGLSAMETLQSIQSVDATLTAVSSVGAERFRRKHPRASISFGASDALLARSSKLYREYIFETNALGYAMAAQGVKLKRLHARGKTVTNGVARGVTDAGLVKLTAWQTELEELDLRDSAVTDKGLWALRTLTELKRLDVRGALVTEKGVGRLAHALPECEILR